jgi:transglutaminase-like putative cysteine protease
MKGSQLIRFLTLAMAVVLIATMGLPSNLAGSTVPDETLNLIKKAGDKEKYPDADAVVILEKSDLEFEEDGTCMNYSYHLVKVLTEAGVDANADAHLGFYKAYDALRVITARVIKQDGAVVDVPADAIKEISSGGLEYMNIYDPDALELVIAFKDLEVGDCVEYYYLDSLYNPPLDNEFDGGDIFQYTDPIIKKVFTVVGPKSKPLRHYVKNGTVDFSKKEKGDKIEYRWQVENMPKIVTEPAMPSLMEVAPFVLATTIDSWEGISRWWNGMVKTKLDMNDALRAEVASLTEGKNTRDEKIDAIYRFVAQKVRYMGLGTGKKKGLEPKPATETYETKYGVCRDVATLMVAMLREAGIDCDVVLTGVGYEIPNDLPFVGFNHAIVAINNPDGTVTYADPTAKYSVDWLPSAEAEQQVLICDSIGSTLDETPYSPADSNIGKIKANSELTENGTYTSQVHFTTSGIYDMAMRGMVRSVPPAQLNMLFGYVMQQIYPGTLLTSFKASDPEDLTKPLEFDFTLQIQNYPLEARGFLLFKSPLALGILDFISQAIFSSASLPERKYPWVSQITFGASEEETIKLPPGFELKAVPQSVQMMRGPIEYKMTYSSDLPVDLAGGGVQVTYRNELLLKSKKLSPEEYKQFKEVMQAKAKTARGEIIIEKEG